MFRLCMAALVVALGGGGLFAHAQQTFSHDTSKMGDFSLVDGSKNPEMIPDSSAYEMFLSLAAEPSDAPPEVKLRQKAILAPMQLNEKEFQTTTDILAKFKANYISLIDRFNKSVEQANAEGRQPNLTGFLAQKSQLVQSTRDALTTSLGAEMMTRFNTHIQNEKRKMKLAVGKEAK